MALTSISAVIKLTLICSVLSADSVLALQPEYKREIYPIPKLAQERAPPWINEAGTPDLLLDFLQNSNTTDIAIAPGRNIITYWKSLNLTIDDFFDPHFRIARGLRDPRVENWWLFQKQMAKLKGHPLEKKVRGTWSHTKAAKADNSQVIPDDLAANQPSTAQPNNPEGPKMANIHRRDGGFRGFIQTVGRIFLEPNKNNIYQNMGKWKPERENILSYDSISDRPFEPHCWIDGSPRSQFGNFGGAQLCRDMLFVINQTVYAEKGYVKLECMAAYEGVTTAVSILPAKYTKGTGTMNVAWGMDWLIASCPRQRNCFGRLCVVGGYIAAHEEESIGVVVGNGEELKDGRVKDKRPDGTGFWF